jgi:hypothetical protein
MTGFNAYKVLVSGSGPGFEIQYLGCQLAKKERPRPVLFVLVHPLPLLYDTFETCNFGSKNDKKQG